MFAWRVGEEVSCSSSRRLLGDISFLGGLSMAMIEIVGSFFLLWFLRGFSFIVSVVCLGILISPVFQLIDGLYSLNQGSPKIMSEDPILQMKSRSRHSRPLIFV